MAFAVDRSLFVPHNLEHQTKQHQGLEAACVQGQAETCNTTNSNEVAVCTLTSLINGKLPVSRRRPAGLLDVAFVGLKKKKKSPVLPAVIIATIPSASPSSPFGCESFIYLFIYFNCVWQTK